MAFTPVEIIALIMIVGGLIKMAVLLVNPKSYMGFAKGIYSKPNIISLMAFIFGAIVLYYLLQSGITIVEILAVTAFVVLLMVFGMAKEVGPLMKHFEAMVKKGNLWKEYWFYTLIWVILLAWGVKELFY